MIVCDEPGCDRPAPHLVKSSRVCAAMCTTHAAVFCVEERDAGNCPVVMTHLFEPTGPERGIETYIERFAQMAKLNIDIRYLPPSPLQPGQWVCSRERGGGDRRTGAGATLKEAFIAMRTDYPERSC